MRNALGVDRRDSRADGFDEALPRRRRHPAVDDRGLEVDHGSSRDDGIGERCSRRREPCVEFRAVMLPYVGRRPEIGRVDAPGVERAFEHRQRGDVDQLGRPAVRAGYGHGAERAGIAGGAAVETAVEHDPAAGEGADVEIDEVPEIAGLAEHQFRAAGGRRVVLQIDRKAAQRLDVGADVAVPPLVHDVARRAGGVGPVPQLERHGDAKAGDALVLRRRQACPQPLDAAIDEIENLARRRIAVGILQHPPDVAEEIDQHQFGAAASDLQPDEEGSVGIERHRDGRLPDLAALGRKAQQQPFVLELAHDDGNGLGRKPASCGRCRTWPGCRSGGRAKAPGARSGRACRSDWCRDDVVGHPQPQTKLAFEGRRPSYSSRHSRACFCSENACQATPMSIINKSDLFIDTAIVIAVCCWRDIRRRAGGCPASA